MSEEQAAVTIDQTETGESKISFENPLTRDDAATAKLLGIILEAIQELEQSPTFVGFSVHFHRATEGSEIQCISLVAHDKLGDVITPRMVESK